MEALADYALGMGWTDWAGWLGTAMFSLSFLVKRRMMLHALGTLACIPKLIYSYDAQAWPLFAGWVILAPIELYQWWRYKRDQSTATARERCCCGH